MNEHGQITATVGVLTREAAIARARELRARDVQSPARRRRANEKGPVACGDRPLVLRMLR
jgi:hypothetical protein